MNKYPLTAMTVHVHDKTKSNNEHHLYEGDAVMSQEQQDRFKALIGDGLSKVTVSQDLGEKDFGSGGGVIVSVTLTCDQNENSIANAIALAHEVANGHAWYYQHKLKEQLLTSGILK